MQNEHLTTSFLVTQDEATQAIEVWVDWIPAVDGSPLSPVRARLEGSDLIIEAQGDSDPDRRPRRVRGLDADVLADLHHGLVWRLCGPSGVLGQHRMTVG